MSNIALLQADTLPPPPLEVNGVIIAYREARASDRGYMISTSSKCLPALLETRYRASARRRSVPMMRALIESSDAIVACNAADEDALVGYAIGKLEDVSYFVYVANDFRRHGIAKKLVEHFGES